MYHNLKELLRQAEDHEVLLSEIILQNEIEQFGTSREVIYEKLEERYEVMKRAAVKALGEPLETAGNLISGIAKQQNEYTEKGKIHLFNPGSVATEGTFGVVNTSKGVLVTNITKIY